METEIWSILGCANTQLCNWIWRGCIDCKSNRIFVLFHTIVENRFVLEIDHVSLVLHVTNRHRFLFSQETVIFAFEWSLFVFYLIEGLLKTSIKCLLKLSWDAIKVFCWGPILLFYLPNFIFMIPKGLLLSIEFSRTIFVFISCATHF